MVLSEGAEREPGIPSPVLLSKSVITSFATLSPRSRLRTIGSFTKIGGLAARLVLCETCYE